MDEFDQFPSTPLTDDRRTEARLCALQAVYQWRTTGLPPQQVIADFSKGHLTQRKAHKQLFTELAQDVAAQEAKYAQMISGQLQDGWTLAKLDAVMLALLFVATAELLTKPDTAKEIILNEYIALGHAFFDAKSVGFINGILHTLATKLRD